MTSKTRANPDYSQSSVNANEVPGPPVNPPEVIDLYRLLKPTCWTSRNRLMRVSLKAWQ